MKDKIIKVDEQPYCSYCGGHDMIEHVDEKHKLDQRYSSWECVKCHAWFEDNPGYGYFTSFPGDLGDNAEDKFSCNTGLPIDKTKRWRTPEGIVRNSGSQEKLEKYLNETQA
jgi:hypothetical protein